MNSGKDGRTVKRAASFETWLFVPLLERTIVKMQLLKSTPAKFTPRKSVCWRFKPVSFAFVPRRFAPTRNPFNKEEKTVV